MKTFGRAALTLLALGMAGQFVPAAAADTQVQALETAKGDVAAAANQERHQRFFSKGGPQQRTSARGRELQRLEGDLDRLIKDLERGKPVAPGEVDQTLRRAEGATR